MSTEEPEPMSCEEARATMAAFLASGYKVGTDAEQQERMRQHMTGCVACEAAYHEMGRTTASLRGIADKRALADARRRGSWRETRPRARGLGAMSVFFAWNQKPPSNRVVRTIWRLRPILIVAFFVFLITELSKPPAPGPRFEVTWTAGRVLVDGKELLADLPNFGLARGSELVTEADSGALAARAGTRFELGPDAHLLLEKVASARARLFTGRLEASGPFELGALSAMMTSEPSSPASLELELVGTDAEPELLLTLTAGRLELVTPRLEQQLEAPASWHLDRFGDSIPPAPPQ